MKAAVKKTKRRHPFPYKRSISQINVLFPNRIVPNRHCSFRTDPQHKDYPEHIILLQLACQNFKFRSFHFLGPHKPCHTPCVLSEFSPCNLSHDNSRHSFFVMRQKLSSPSLRKTCMPTFSNTRPEAGFRTA